MIPSIARLDESLFRAINGSPWTGPTLDAIAQALSGPWLWLLVPALVILVGLFRFDGRLVRGGLLALAALGLTDLLSARVVKPTVGRPRPCASLADVRVPPKGCGGYHGFPSNHSANGMAMVGTIFFAGARTWGLALLPLAVLVGLSRVYQGVHYPGDVLGGFILGGAVAWLVAWVARWVQRRAGERRLIRP